LDRFTSQCSADHVADQPHIRTRQRLPRPKCISEAQTDDRKVIPLRRNPIMMLGSSLVHALDIQRHQRLSLGDGAIRVSAVLMRGAEIDYSSWTRLRQGANDSQMGGKVE